jgi:Phosphoketolase
MTPPAVPDVVMACCGDVPTLETLAAVTLIREHLPELKVRVVNVVDLMRWSPRPSTRTACPTPSSTPCSPRTSR